MKQITRKVNLGCGPSGINGWINYDWGLLPLVNKIPFMVDVFIGLGLLASDYKQNWPEFKLVDIRKKLPLKNKSVNFIYCSHVLEHFEKWEAVGILKECRRVLKRGGVARIVVPDLAKMVGFYKTGESDRFCREFMGFKKDIEPKTLWQKLSRKFIRGHQWSYDSKSLKRLAEESGFKNIHPCQFREGQCPDLEKLDLVEHKKISLYAELS